MRGIVGALLGACLALTAPAVRATVGGESLCEVLGYEASTGRVYVYQVDGSGAASFGCVAWLEPRGPEAGRLRGVDWDRFGENTAQDPELRQRLADLRASLAPLKEVAWPTLPLFSQVVAQDSIPNLNGQSRRFKVSVGFSADPEALVTCWSRPTVARPAVYELPDGESWVWILAFIGDNFETGYETQVPMLWRLHHHEEPAVIEWRRWAD